MPTTWHTNAVKKFNALPRTPEAPSGLVPNRWHFDLRYVPLDPPSHLLFIVQLESLYIHSERLPLDISEAGLGFVFFPESGEEAAPEVAKALIHSFLDDFGNHKFDRNPPAPRAPWKLTTEDASLAEAVGREFTRLGVRSELCKIEVVEGRSLTIAQEAFEGLWGALKKSMGMSEFVAAALSPPSSIVFKSNPLDPWVTKPDDDEFAQGLAYAQRLSVSQPVSKKSASGGDMMKDLKKAMALLESKSNETVRVEADAGNSESAIDFALRLQVGVNCTRDRRLCRTYLMKAIMSPTSTQAIQSRAHALSIDWYSMATKNKITYRYLHAAAHHANQSTLLANGNASPAVLWFAMKILEPHSHTALELCTQYKAVWAAWEKRKKENDKEAKKAEKKRAKNTNRYICADVNCVIQGDKGGMLSQCAGKCDHDKKPAYCSKECQRADWKNHKPFCQPGADCSILEKDQDLPVAGGKGGSLSIPVELPDGRTMMVSSSSLGADALKEIRERSLESSQSQGRSSRGLSSSFGVEIRRIN